MPPPIKPPARARKIRAWHRGRVGVLSEPAIAELFRSAVVLTEGGLDGAARWYGSIMITFDLDRFATRCRDMETLEDLDAVVDAVEGSVRVRVRAHRMACSEIYRRFPDRDVGTAQLWSRFSRDGTELLLDIDLEAPIDLSASVKS